MTIDQLVNKFHADYVSIDNPLIPGVSTPGTTEVEDYHVDYDVDGVHLFITIKKLRYHYIIFTDKSGTKYLNTYVSTWDNTLEYIASYLKSSPWLIEGYITLVSDHSIDDGEEAMLLANAS